MYTIYAGGVCIYNDVNNLEELRVISPELELSDNTAGTLTMTLPQTNIGYGLIQRMETEIVVKRNGMEIWSGRALSEKMDFWKNRLLTCEGELAYLNDSLQPQRLFENPSPSSFLREIIATHNAKVTEDKRFVVGAVTVDGPMVNEETETDEYYDDVYVYTNFNTTWECILEKLVDHLGGHLRIRKENGVRYLDYLKDYTDTSSQVIEFGKNLMDFVVSYDETDFCTVLIPLGEQYEDGEVEGLEGYLTIAEVNAGRDYLVNQEAVDAFGWLERVVHFDEIDDAQELLGKGREYLSNIQFGTMTLEVNAIDMNYMDVNTEEIKLLNQVRVKSAPHGLDRMFPVTSLKIPIDTSVNTTFTLGTEAASGLTARTNEASSKLMETIRKLPSKTSILSAAKETATVLIASATNGFITITKNGNGSEELYISDTMDYKKASRLWRWNINGLGYSKDGGKTYGLAITMDGSIVADFITSGKLSADRIYAGKLQDTTGKNYWNLDSGKFVSTDAEITGIFKQYVTRSNELYLSLELSGNQVKMYDWAGEGAYCGSIGSVRDTQGVNGIGVWTASDKRTVFGYTDTDDGTGGIKSVISWDSDDIEGGDPPKVINTSSGSLYIGPHEITVKNGFVQSWITGSVNTGDVNIGGRTLTFTRGLLTNDSGVVGASGTLFPDMPGGGISVENGCATGWGMSWVTKSYIQFPRAKHNKDDIVTYVDVWAKVVDGLIVAWSTNLDDLD